MDTSGNQRKRNWRFLLVILFTIIACIALDGSSSAATLSGMAASGWLAPAWKSAAPLRGIDGTVERYVPGIADSLALRSGEIFMNRSCGGELYGPPSHLEQRLTTNPNPFGTSSMYANYAACDGRSNNGQPWHILSINVAVDDNYAYWLSRNGKVVRRRHDTSPLPQPEVVWTMANPSPTADPPAYSIAVNNTNIFWNEGRRFYRTLKSPGGPYYALNSAANFPRKLYATDDQRLFFLDGSTLKVMDVSVSPYTIYTVHANVSDYAIQGGWIYVGVNLNGYYEMRSVYLSDYSYTRTHYSSPSDPSLRAGAVAVSTNPVNRRLFWFERQGLSGGQIFAQILDYAAPSAQTGWLSRMESLAADGTYVFWTDRASGVYRLTPGMSVPDIPGDMRITELRVTQGMQVADNPIPLIGLRTTLVRVFVASEPGALGPWQNVIARLEVEGTALPRYSQPMPQLPTASREASLNETFNFYLTADEIQEGTRQITVTLFTLAGRREANRANNSLSTNVTFGPLRGLELTAIRYTNKDKGAHCSTDADNGVVTPWSNIRTHFDDGLDLLPLTWFDYVPAGGVGVLEFDDSTCEAYKAAINWAHNWIDRAYPSGGRMALVMQPDWLHPGGTCSTYSSGNRVINIQDFWRNHTLPHEAGHGFGGVYTCCHTWDASTHYPRAGEPGVNFRWNWMGDFYGLGTYTTTHVIAGSLDPSILTHDAFDLMSYGPNRWPSPYTYCKHIKYSSGGSVCCPDSVEGGCSSPDVPARTSAFGGVEPASVVTPLRFSTPGKRLEPGMKTNPQAPEQDEPYLYVSGWISPTGQVELDPFEILYSSKDISTPGTANGSYTMRLLAGDGTELGKYTFDPIVRHTDPVDSSPDPGLDFSAYLPWKSDTRTITLERDQSLVAERKVSDNSPLVSLLDFSPPEFVFGTMPVYWTGDDADADDLTYSVWYSPDDGATWLPVGVLLTGNSLAIDFDGLPGSASEAARVRVLASDGVLTGMAVSDVSFTVTHKIPQVKVTFQYNPDGSTASLQASANDPEDGIIIDPASFSWYSELDGELGNGLSLNTDQLSPGFHDLWVYVTDSDGMQGAGHAYVIGPPEPDSNSQEVVSWLGATLPFNLLDSSLPASLTVPAGAYDEDLRVSASLVGALPPSGSDGTDDPASPPDPPGTLGASFVISAATLSGSPVTEFNQPLTLTVDYQDEDLPPLIEESLSLFVWDDTDFNWDLVPGMLDARNNRLTVPVPHLSRFAVVGRTEKKVYLPLLRK